MKSKLILNPQKHIFKSKETKLSLRLHQFLFRYKTCILAKVKLLAIYFMVMVQGFLCICVMQCTRIVEE